MITFLYVKLSGYVELPSQECRFQNAWPEPEWDRRPGESTAACSPDKSQSVVHLQHSPNFCYQQEHVQPCCPEARNFPCATHAFLTEASDPLPSADGPRRIFLRLFKRWIRRQRSVQQQPTSHRNGPVGCPKRLQQEPVFCKFWRSARHRSFCWSQYQLAESCVPPRRIISATAHTKSCVGAAIIFIARTVFQSFAQRAFPEVNVVNKLWASNNTIPKYLSTYLVLSI